MEKEVVDYSWDLMDTTPIWRVDPPQRPTTQTLENPHELYVHDGAFISHMEDGVANLNDLGLLQPTLATTSDFIYNLHD